VATGFGSPESQWIAEVQNMAARLQVLAATAPASIEDRQCHYGCATEATMSDVERWEAAASRLHQLQDEAAALDQEAKRVESECDSTDAEASSLAENIAAKIAAEKQALAEEHATGCAELAHVTHIAAEAMQAAAEAKEASMRRSSATAQKISDLRAQLTAQVAAANAAQEKVIRARTDLEQAQELPALRSRQRAAEARKKQLSKESAQLQQQAEALRAEEASFQGGGGTRRDTLEARVAQLERECQDLQQGCGDQSGDVNVGEELARAQDCNHRLLVEVREARGDRDEAQTALEKLKKEVSTLQSRLQCNDGDLEDIQEQVRRHTERRSVVKEEVEAKKSQIALRMQQSSDLEEKIQKWRKKHTEAFQAQSKLTAIRQAAEQKVTVLECHMQHALAKLEKEKPGAPLSRCLMQSRPQGRLSMTCKLRQHRDHRFGGSDAGSESIDADVSTTAGESVAETLVDIGTSS
jgi:chromosome segregation ATPase